MAAILFAGLAGTAAAETRIDCPLQQARRTIVGNMAKGWWTTPIVDRLSQTKIMTIGGKPTLVCVYGNAGSVQREAPAGRKCRAITGGFVCTGGATTPAPSVQLQQKPQVPSTPKPAPDVTLQQKIPLPTPQQPAPRQGQPVTLSTGDLTVRQTYTFDLDRGVVGQGAIADVWFQAKTAKELYLTPRNGAAMSVSGTRNRGMAGCSKARYSSDSLPLARLPTGTYICVRTSEGRISEFRVNGLSAGSPRTLELGYTTWR